MSDACKGSVKDLFAPAASPNTPSQLGRAVPCAPRVHPELATSRRLSLSSSGGEGWGEEVPTPGSRSCPRLPLCFCPSPPPPPPLCGGGGWGESTPPRQEADPALVCHCVFAPPQLSPTLPALRWWGEGEATGDSVKRLTLHKACICSCAPACLLIT